MNRQMMSSTDVDDPRWLKFVEGCPGATPFHHPAWASLIQECYDHRAFALTRSDPEARIVDGLPVVEVAVPFRRRRWVSLPFTDHCQPLSHGEEGAVDLARLLDAARCEAGIGSIEVRAELFESPARTKQVGVVHSLALEPDSDAVYRRLKRSSVRKGIREAQQSGLCIRQGDSPLDLTRTFYGLHVQTRRRLGVPVQPRRYLDLLWKHMIEPGRGFLLLVYHGPTAIAGAVFLAWNGTVIYKYGASDHHYWHLSPNHLVMWAAISWGCARGFHTFDFGRSDANSKGLRQFKSGWANEVALTYSTVGSAASEREGRLAGIAGTVIRRSPQVLCRFAGEILYRFAA